MSTEELQTILCELAAIVNNRPLTHVGTQDDDPIPLTPAHFLNGGPSGAPLCSIASLDHLGGSVDISKIEQPEDYPRRIASARTGYLQALSDRWRREYITQLRSANLNPIGKPRVIRDGDVCLLRDENLRRPKWNLVRVLRGLPGRDGAIRTYQIRLANGHETRRAAQLLYPLEVAPQTEGPSTAPEEIQGAPMQGAQRLAEPSSVQRVDC